MPLEKRRVLLVCSQHLFGQGLETILRRVEGMKLLGPIELFPEDFDSRLLELRPDAVIMVDEGEHSLSTYFLTAAILQQFPSLPVISAGLEQNTFRIYSAHTLPARSSDLVEAILNLPSGAPWDASWPASHSRS